MNYTYRFLARIVLEAETALFVGSGNQGLFSDALIQKDHHGLPMINGTSLTGVLRHSLEDFNKEPSNGEKKEPEKGKLKYSPTSWEKIFGYQKDQEGLGAKLRLSSAYLLLPNGNIVEGMEAPNEDVKVLFEMLPTRQHVRINHRGAAEDQGLFDNEVVYKGCRFKFEIELRGDGTEVKQWKELLNTLHSPLFRIGQGTRNGYGQLKVYSCKARTFNLSGNKVDFDDYLEMDPSLNLPVKGVEGILAYKEEKLQQYHLELEPDNSFFLFASAYATEDVDQSYATEEVLDYGEYKNNSFKKVEQVLIPASSIKGALSHRTAFHYNRLKNVFVDKMESTDQIDKVVGKNNEAVRSLFGYEAKEKSGQRGRVIINDLSYENPTEKVFNHVAIDRFTGGAIDGALFSEKVCTVPQINLKISLEEHNYDELVIKAFEAALEDICKGYLPLGGMTTKGHGIFKGTLKVIHPKTIEHV